MFTIGGINEDLCDADSVVYADVSRPGYWQFGVDAIFAGTEGIKRMVTDPSVDATQVIADTGTSLMTMPPQVHCMPTFIFYQYLH